MRPLVQKYGVAGILLAFGIVCLCVAYVPPLPELTAAAYAHAGDSALSGPAGALFAFLGDPSVEQVNRYVDRTIIAVSLGMFALLLGLSRLGALPRAARDPATGRRASGLGRRLMVMRVCAVPLMLLALALASGAWLSVVRFGARGDQPAAQPHLELSAHFKHPELGRWGLRAHSAEPARMKASKYVSFRVTPLRPVTQLHVAMRRADDAVLEFIFADRQLEPLRILERDCASSQGSVRIDRRKLATRSGLVSSGELHVSCPAQQAEVHAHAVPGHSAEEMKLFGGIPRVRYVGELSAVAALVLLMALALGVQGFSARYDDRKADDIWQASAKMTGVVAFGALALFACVRALTREDADIDEVRPADHLVGCVHLQPSLFGVGHTAPDRCLASRSASFEGVRFDFPDGGELRELRLDTAHKGQETAEFRFNRNRPPILIRARDCGQFWAPLRLESSGLNASPAQRAYGELHLSCADQGVEAHLSYRGCEASE